MRVVASNVIVQYVTIKYSKLVTIHRSRIIAAATTTSKLFIIFIGFLRG